MTTEELFNTIKTYKQVNKIFRMFGYIIIICFEYKIVLDKLNKKEGFPS